MGEPCSSAQFRAFKAFTAVEPSAVSISILFFISPRGNQVPTWQSLPCSLPQPHPLQIPEPSASRR